MSSHFARGAGSLLLVVCGVLALHGEGDVDLLIALVLGATGLIVVARERPLPD